MSLGREMAREDHLQEMQREKERMDLEAQKEQR